MMIYGMATLVAKINSNQRQVHRNDYHHLLTRLSPQQRYFMETGKGTPPKVSPTDDWTLDYVHPMRLDKTIHNRFVAFTGETKDFLQRITAINEHYLLSTARLNRMFSIDAFNALERHKEWKWLSHLVILSKLKFSTIDQMKYLDLNHLNSITLRLEDRFTMKMSLIITQLWRVSKCINIHLHCRDYDPDAVTNMCCFMNFTHHASDYRVPQDNGDPNGGLPEGYNVSGLGG